MTRRIPLLVAALVVVGLIATVPLGAAMTGEPGASTAVDDGVAADGNTQVESENGTSDISPGERLSGVIGVQGAEVEGEVESRSFGIRIAEAETDEERAAVIADQLDRNEERLAELRDRQRELRERRSGGNVSDGAYAAQEAKIGAQAASVNRTTERSAEVASGLPADVLAEQGVDAERIRTLREHASELSGPETAAIAREIGGNRTGAPMGPDRGDRPGAGNGLGGSEGEFPVSGGPNSTGNASEAENRTPVNGPERDGAERDGANVSGSDAEGNATVGSDATGGSDATAGSGSGEDASENGATGDGTDAGGDDVATDDGESTNGDESTSDGEPESGGNAGNGDESGSDPDSGGDADGSQGSNGDTGGNDRNGP
ncbi:hypothetical protein [Halorubrum sp. F4]|uniref:DUF7096 domain-containing protein n=1 Tax=Halorubrum sp. F4 TaxID=2989715 RepID=UPI00248190A4|nr:hypothetical protein [Halorubrum sp. F4]